MTSNGEKNPILTWKRVCSSSPCSRNHLAALLYFRGLMRGREHQLILQKLTELKKRRGGGDAGRVLFAAIPATVNTNCLSSLPFSCLSLLS